MEHTLTVLKTCPFCGLDALLELTDEESAQFMLYHNGIEPIIHVAMPNTSRIEREFLKTGICPRCYAKLTTPTEHRIKYREV